MAWVYKRFEMPNQRAQNQTLIAFACDRDYFAPGTALEIEALESTRDEYGMGVFDCTVSAAGTRAASAMLSVYLPANVETYLGSLEP